MNDIDFQRDNGNYRDFRNKVAQENRKLLIKVHRIRSLRSSYIRAIKECRAEGRNNCIHSLAKYSLTKAVANSGQMEGRRWILLMMEVKL
jgi:hypothetical protein